MTKSVTKIRTKTKTKIRGAFKSYIIFVANAADIVRGAKFFMWSNLTPHANC